MTILTGGGSLANAYLDQFKASVASVRELGEEAFLDRLKQASVVIHNAATIENTDLELSVTRNFDFTRFIITRLEQINPNAHLILLSSMSILDPADSRAYGDVFTMTAYAYSKYLAETYALKSSLKSVSCVRFSTLFFQDPEKDGLSKLIHQAATTRHITIFNGGEARRNFLPIRIAVQYVHNLAERPARGKQTYTFAAPEATRFSEVVELVKKQLPGLQVEDKKLASGNPVLADFAQDSMRRVGEIEFSLAEEIETYLKSLGS